MKIEIIKDIYAENLIYTSRFIEEWRELYSQCPWKTVFQSDKFVITWYEVYKPNYSPIIVIGRDNNNRLKGLLTLAIDRQSRELVFSGKNNAEYHAWLSDPEDGDSFIEPALSELARNYPKTGLLFMFAPPNLPLTVFDSHWGKRSTVRSIERGLMSIGDGSSSRSKLKKKQNKLNRLKQMGTVHLDRLVTAKELDEVFDRLVEFKTLRLWAANKQCNFMSDQFKKLFYMKLLEAGGIVYASALRINDNLISAHLHVYNEGQLALGLIGHSPNYSKHSPGELHLLMTATEMSDENIPFFDLTPGGEYKNRFATDHDTTYEIQIYFNNKQLYTFKLLRKLKRLIMNSIKIVYSDFNVDFSKIDKKTALLQDKLDKLNHVGIPGIIKWCSNRPATLKEMPDINICNRDLIKDILRYKPYSIDCPTRNDFFRAALGYYEKGLHSYSYVKDGVLIHCRWINEETSEILYSFTHP